jgi:antitoxin component YwqK of YwqJK toxin-antitoxin module
MECENDLRNGVYKKYNPNVLLTEVSYFLKGSKSGITTYYFANGNKSSEGKFESLPLDDKEYNKEDSYYGSDKKLYQNSLFHCGELDQKNDHKMVVHQKIGEWKEYYPTGQLFSIGSYQGGIKSGEWKYFSSNGTLRAQGKMKNDFFCFYCSNAKINSKFAYYRSSLDFSKYESLTENVKIYGEDGILEGEGNLESSEVAIDNKTNEFIHNYKKGVPYKIFKNKKVISEFKRDDSGSISMIKSGENGDLFGTGPSLNSTPNGCWTLKNGIKKFYSMGIEDSLNGELQNCK